MRRAIELAWIALTVGWAVSGVAVEALAEAKARIAQCIEKQGEEYVEARDWLVQHPEALELLDGGSWREQWVKRICRAWTENRALYESTMAHFELAETRASRAVRKGVPGDPFLLRLLSKRHGEKLVPLMVECLWKTSRAWRRYKAWRVFWVVEYLKSVGDASILDPAIDVLASRSWGGEQGSDPGSKYPRMDRGMRAMADLTDQMAPYKPVELILQFGEESTLGKLKEAMENPETSEASKRVLDKTIELLRHRLDGKRQGLPVKKVELFDMYVQFGDRSTLENMRRMWGERGGSHGPKVRATMTGLEKRLEAERKAKEGSEKSD